MKISKETMTVLKNFSGINSNIMIRAGNTLATISPQKNVMASVSVAEQFPVDFGIYDLSEFLGTLSLFEDPDVSFSGDYATISQGARRIRYNAADKAVLTLPPEKQIKFPNVDVEIVVPAETLAFAIRTASVLRSSDISIVGDGTDLRIVVSDLKNSGSNSFDEVIGKSDLTFKANMKGDNLRLLPQEYTVSISSKKISRWAATKGDMVVFVALETTSVF